MSKLRQLSRRDFLRAALVTAAGATVAACQPLPAPAPAAPGAAAAPTAAPAASAPTTVRLWHHWGGDRVPLMDKMIKDFMAKYPNIKVESTLQPWEQRLEKLMASISAGSPPDVTMLAQQDMPPFVKAKALLPLKQLMDGAGITADQYYEPEAKAMQYNGDVWVLPNAVGGAQNIMFYIPKDFQEVGLDPEKPPATWDELRDATKKLVTFDGDKIKRMGCSQYAGADGFRHVMAANDAPMVSDDGRKSLMDNERTVEAVQFLLDIIDLQGGIQKVAAWQTAASAFETNPFYTGLQSIHFEGDWFYFYIKAQAPKLEYKSALCPVNRNSPWVDSYNYCWGYAIPKGAKDVNAAWTLVKWLSYDLEGSCEFIKAQLQGHPLKACFNQPEFKAASFWPIIDESLQKTKVYGPAFSVWNEQGDIMTAALDEVNYHKKTPAEAVKDMSDKFQKALDEWWATA